MLGMPPASPAVTFEWRMTSSSVVFMVDVAHDGDHRGAKLQVLLLVFQVKDDFFFVVALTRPAPRSRRSRRNGIHSTQMSRAIGSSIDWLTFAKH